jgi:hypothetical protein
MSVRSVIVVMTQAVLVAGVALALGSGKVPLGVPGEWEWQRVHGGLEPARVLLALGVLAGYVSLAAVGYRMLERSRKGVTEAFWVTVLTLAGVVTQGALQEAAPEGYGLSKWILALQAPGSSGYYTVARKQMADPWRFLRDYPGWVANQDALHVGTHPPGLFLVARGMLGLMDANPGLAKGVMDGSPGSVSRMYLATRESTGLTRSDAAALALTGALTLLACSLMVVPLYALARTSFDAKTSWVCACFWPLVPSALLFQPTADAAFPLIAATSLALACGAVRKERADAYGLAWVSGMVMAVGMLFTLAFLAVGLIVAIVILGTFGITWRRRLALIFATGAGFLGVTLAFWAITSSNPLATWWANQRNHARFYVEYPRSYLAWVVENPIETAIGLGIPASLWAAVGMASPRRLPMVTWATLGVLALLTLSGRSLSEVGRLWLPFFPALLLATGAGFQRLQVGPKTLAISLALVGIEVVILQAMIQVVYPI